MIRNYVDILFAIFRTIISSLHTICSPELRIALSVGGHSEDLRKDAYGDPDSRRRPGAIGHEPDHGHLHRKEVNAVCGFPLHQKAGDLIPCTAHQDLAHRSDRIR